MRHISLRVSLRGSRARLPPGVEVGRHTYGYDGETFSMFTEGARIVVGAFCSISPQVRILGGGEHITNRVTTFPLNALIFDPRKRNAIDAVDEGPTVIGNDVWIGIGATILAGVRIGDGAVIGASTVVTRSVPPYAVVVGNPGHVIRYRFASEIRDRLLALRWWEWSDADIRALKPWFMADVESFLEEAERVRDAGSPLQEKPTVRSPSARPTFRYVGPQRSPRQELFS
jgi:acetyltransferase-like isoleucine patch superfamily enzyme